MQKSEYWLLDMILIVSCILIAAAIILALVFVAIPQSQLPIISGLGGTVLGIITTYAAFRWQIQNQKKADPIPADPTATPVVVNNVVTPDQGGQNGQSTL